VLIIKTGNYGYLKSCGVSDTALGILKNHGVKIVLAGGKLSFQDGDGSVLATLDSKDAAVVEAAANAVVASLFTATAEGKKPSVAEKSAAPAPKVEKGAPAKPKPEPVNSIINLKDAEALHQRVRGTSANSVYVVVAINDRLRVAAKIKGNGLAVRVESPQEFSSSDISAFAGVGVVNHGHYMSGHFSCTNATPARVLGAILLGTGLKFDTPLPDIQAVIAGSN
jgi:hypothetical protein